MTMVLTTPQQLQTLNAGVRQISLWSFSLGIAGGLGVCWLIGRKR